MRASTGSRMTTTDTPGAMQEAVRSYADACRARIPGFVARHFGWRGSLRLHRSAVGLDLLRAPLNVLLVGPTLFLRLAGLACRWLGWRRLGTWLARRNLFVETNLARRMADLVMSELLRLDDAPWAIDPDSAETDSRADRRVSGGAQCGRRVRGRLRGDRRRHRPGAGADAQRHHAGPVARARVRPGRRHRAHSGSGRGPGRSGMAGIRPTRAGARRSSPPPRSWAAFALLATFMGLITDPVLHADGIASAPPRPCGRHAGACGAGRSRREPGAARPLCCPAHRPRRRAPFDDAHDALMSRVAR